MREVGPVSRAAVLKRVKQEVIRKSSFLKHKAVIDYKEVYHLIRGFFKEYLNKHYEFTISELKQEISRIYIPTQVKGKIHDLLDDIAKMEYDTTSYRKDELIGVLERFEEVVNGLVKFHNKNQSLISKIKRFIFKEEEEPIVISDLPVIENSDELYIHISTMLERLYLLINKKKLHKSVKQYKEILSLYGEAPDDIKKEFYPSISEAYEKISSMKRA